MSTQLIDTYVSEVGRHLPQKNRADIEAEIRSALQDLLDERARQTGKPVDDEETVLDVLKGYGDPEKVAASYLPERYVIGPSIYPAYVKVLQIVLPIIGVLALLGLGFSLGKADEPLDVFTIIAQSISEFFGSMISALGSITLIFALLERFIPNLKTKETHWDPRSLFKVSPPDQVKPAELIVEIFFTSLALLIFNFYPQVFGYTPSLNGVVESGNWQGVIILPFLSDAFMNYIPALTAVWILTIILDSILIQRGRWENWSRWSMIGIKALMIGIAAVMLAGPSLVAVNADSLLASGLSDPEVASLLVNLMNQAVKLALALTIFFSGLDLVKSLVRLLRVKPPVMITEK